MTESKIAYTIATQTLGKESLYMWTFTFGELLDINATRKRWNHLLTLIGNSGRNSAGSAFSSCTNPTVCMFTW